MIDESKVFTRSQLVIALLITIFAALIAVTALLAAFKGRQSDLH